MEAFFNFAASVTDKATALVNSMSHHGRGRTIHAHHQTNVRVHTHRPKVDWSQRKTITNRRPVIRTVDTMPRFGAVSMSAATQPGFSTAPTRINRHPRHRQIQPTSVEGSVRDMRRGVIYVNPHRVDQRRRALADTRLLPHSAGGRR